MPFLLPVLLGGLAVFIFVFAIYKPKQSMMFRLFLGLVFLLQAIIYVCIPVFQLETPQSSQSHKVPLQGGTLHKQSWSDWQNASIQNRLATATDYLKMARKQGLFLERIRGLDEYRPWAAALVSCMEWEYSIKNGPLPEAVARNCLDQQKLNQFFKP